MMLLGVQHTVDDHDVPASELPDEAFGATPVTPPLLGDDAAADVESSSPEVAADPGASGERPCWNCGGSGVRCCEWGADR